MMHTLRVFELDCLDCKAVARHGMLVATMMLQPASACPDWHAVTRALRRVAAQRGAPTASLADAPPDAQLLDVQMPCVRGALHGAVDALSNMHVHVLHASMAPGGPCNCALQAAQMSRECSANPQRFCTAHLVVRDMAGHASDVVRQEDIANAVQHALCTAAPPAAHSMVRVRLQHATQAQLQTLSSQTASASPGGTMHSHGSRLWSACSLNSVLSAHSAARLLQSAPSMRSDPGPMQLGLHRLVPWARSCNVRSERQLAAHAEATGAPVVSASYVYSGGVWSVTLRCTDRKGLLHDLAAALAADGASISSVRTRRLQGSLMEVQLAVTRGEAASTSPRGSAAQRGLVQNLRAVVAHPIDVQVSLKVKN